MLRRARRDTIPSGTASNGRNSSETMRTSREFSSATIIARVRLGRRVVARVPQLRQGQLLHDLAARAKSADRPLRHIERHIRFVEGEHHAVRALVVAPDPRPVDQLQVEAEGFLQAEEFALLGRDGRRAAIVFRAVQENAYQLATAVGYVIDHDRHVAEAGEERAAFERAVPDRVGRRVDEGAISIARIGLQYADDDRGGDQEYDGQADQGQQQAAQADSHRMDGVKLAVPAQPHDREQHAHEERGREFASPR